MKFLPPRKAVLSLWRKYWIETSRRKCHTLLLDFEISGEIPGS